MVQVPQLRRAWARFLIPPLVIWLVLAATGVLGVLWGQHRGREGMAQRFQLRVGLMRDFVNSYVADLIERERVQAEAFLAGRTVTTRDFTRSVASFGYPAAVLLDDRGRLIQSVPTDPSRVGRDLTTYAHLRTAVRAGRSAVSAVVPSAVRGLPVVAFAVPFESATGRRVFSGAVAISRSPLGTYLASGMSLSGVRMQLVDTSGAIVAANREFEARVPTLAVEDPALASALGTAEHGRYRTGGAAWRYASYPIPGTPWRLSATVEESVLFASVRGNEVAARVAVGTAAVVGLLVVAAAARARRNRHQSQLNEQRFRKVFDTSRIGMLISDPSGRLVRVNPAFGRMLGRTSGDLVGRHFNEVTHPDDVEHGTSLMRDCLAGRMDDYELEKRYVHADDSVVEAAVTSALLRDPAGEPQFFATQIIDMTERHALERERSRHEAQLAERAEQLQQANAQMTDFIAMLSHDVRQPLATVVATSELLIEEWAELPEDVRRHYMEKITAAGHRADLIVTEILTLAQLDAGALVAYPVRMDVAHTVREAATAASAGAAEPIAVMSPDETVAMADPAHLHLILGNLLGNATKYGAPPVTVTVINAPHHVRVQISDSGEGVPADFVPFLFDRFARAETGVALTKAGTGLGLYLVRQLAEAGGITVGYQPNEPHGSTFVLTLPRVPHKPQVTGRPSSLRTTPRAEPSR